MTSEFPPGPGGIGTHAHQVASQLAARDWAVTVFGAQDYASTAEITEFNGQQPFDVFSAPARPRRIGTIWQAMRLVRRIRPDVILASGEHFVYLAAAVSRVHRIPWVAVEHGRIPSKQSRPIKRWAFERADAVISVSNYSGQKLLELGIRPKRLVTIWNGADSQRFQVLDGSRRGRARDALDISDAPLLVTLGTVSARKGQDVVIRAMPRILEQHPSTHYVMAGRPHCQAEFSKLATELRVEHRVRFLGTVDGTFAVDLLNDADLVLLTSRHVPQGFEGFGIAAVEAALCGTPSIVTANSGLSEAVLHEQTGLVVPPEDPIAIADAVVALLGDDARRTQLGGAARDRALSELTWERVGTRYCELLEAVLDGQGEREHERAS